MLYLLLEECVEVTQALAWLQHYITWSEVQRVEFQDYLALTSLSI